MGKTILLVEDEAVIALAEKQRLEHEGFEVLLAASGEEALETALGEGHRLDLVLMDIDLGSGMDGTEAARRILEFRDIPLLFLSSHMEKEIVARTEEISSYGYVVKASSYTVLDASIKMAFKLHAAHRELRERGRALESITTRFDHLALHGRSYVWEVDVGGLFTYVSPSIEAVLGYRPEEVVGKLHFYDLLPETGREETRKAVLDLLARGEKFSDRVSLALAKGGRPIWISTSGIPVTRPDGELRGYQGTDRDVSARIDVEKALHSSKKVIEQMESAARELKILADCLPARVAILDTDDLRYRFVNRTFAESHGIPRETILGMTVREVIGEESYSVGLPHIEEARRGVTSRFENTIRGPSGERWNEVTLVPVRGNGGAVDRLVMLGVDITERKRGERVVAGLLEEKSLVLREVHHRIKNNMSVISGMLEFQAAEQGDEEAKTLLLEASGRVRSMGFLYDRIYRSEGMGPLPVREFLTDLVMEIIGIFPGGKKVTLDADFDAFTLSERILSPLGIIVNELVTNSYKYAFVGRNEGRLFLEARSAAGLCRMTYMDDGAGFAKPAAFDEGAEGFGMKLISILVTQIGGSLSVDPGPGARFVIEFPLGPT